MTFFRAPRESVSEPEVQEKTEVRNKPTVQEILEWAREQSGVVTYPWYNHPTSCKLGMIVFPPTTRDTLKKAQSSEIIKDAINKFAPHLDLARMHNHCCMVYALNGSKDMKIWLMESNVQLQIADSLSAADLRLNHFPVYSSVNKPAHVTTFLTVAHVKVQHSEN